MPTKSHLDIEGLLVEARTGGRVSGRVWWSLALLATPFLVMLSGERPESPSVGLVEPWRVDALGTTLPLHVNERVERWMDAFQGPRKAEFEDLLEQRGVFGPIIRAKLRARGMPEELVYLAMMESGLSNYAVSPVSAVGLWQFMTPTAQQYGLLVNEWVDERRDPIRATDAALEYLETLYDRFGSWYLAAAAYNSGPGRVEMVLNLHAEGRTGDEDLYWEVLDHLPRETREYVPKFVAATMLAENARAYGFDVSRAAPYRYDEVFVPGGTPLARIAKALDVETRVLKGLNPHLLRGATPPGGIYGVRIPVGDTRVVLAALNGRPGSRRAASRRAD